MTASQLQACSGSRNLPNRIINCSAPGAGADSPCPGGTFEAAYFCVAGALQRGNTAMDSDSTQMSEQMNRAALSAPIKHEIIPQALFSSLAQHILQEQLSSFTGEDAKRKATSSPSLLGHAASRHPLESLPSVPSTLVSAEGLAEVAPEQGGEPPVSNQGHPSLPG